jgi:hypothetical protein
MNKRLSLVKAILMAADAVGDPSRHGKGGRVGYLQWVAINYPHTFVMLLAKAIPLQQAEEHVASELDGAKERLLEKLSRVFTNFQYQNEVSMKAPPNGEGKTS